VGVRSESFVYLLLLVKRLKRKGEKLSLVTPSRRRGRVRDLPAKSSWGEKTGKSAWLISLSSTSRRDNDGRRNFSGSRRRPSRPSQKSGHEGKKKKKNLGGRKRERKIGPGGPRAQTGAATRQGREGGPFPWDGKRRGNSC